MTNGFIKNYDLLEESSEIEDLLGFENICGKFTNKLNSITKSSVIALVGPFGTGKSTMLHNLMRERVEKELWVEFDAWKYPDRKDLWEGFILDLLNVISPKELAKAKKEIEGTQNESKKIFVKAVSKFHIPGFNMVEGLLNYFLNTSPARRVNDIQQILEKHLRKIKKDLFIILEDIDRSGDAGIFFLETLKQFLRTVCLDKKVVVIVPMANDNYHKNIDSYLKCIDYFEFFEQGEIKLEQFINKIFDKDVFDVFSDTYKIIKKQTISFFRRSI